MALAHVGRMPTARSLAVWTLTIIVTLVCLLAHRVAARADDQTIAQQSPPRDAARNATHSEDGRPLAPVLLSVEVIPDEGAPQPPSSSHSQPERPPESPNAAAR
jgi:hypothetical protein